MGKMKMAATSAKGKWLDLAFKILSAFVIPLLVWGITLEVGQAVQNEKIARLEEDVESASAIKEGVSKNTEALARVEEQISGTNKRLDEIRADLRRSLPPL